MASFVELYIDQGTDFSYTLSITDNATNANVNVASYNISSQMRRSYYSANITANLNCTINDAANGIIMISLPANQTANIKAGRYLFDVKANTGNVIQRLLEGIITVTPSVTR